MPLGQGATQQNGEAVSGWRLVLYVCASLVVLALVWLVLSSVMKLVGEIQP